MSVPAPLRRGGILFCGYLLGYSVGAAAGGLLLSVITLALAWACIEVTSRLTED